MAYRYTLLDAKEAVAPAINLCVTDTTGALVSAINRTAERLLYGGKWQGTYGRYRVCLTNTSCLTWIREIETVEAWALNRTPHEVRNQFYEFLGNGPGLMRDNSCCSGWQLIDDGEAVSFDDPVGENMKLAVYCDTDEAVGSVITLKYYRSDSKEKVRTQVSGTWIEGEQITLPAAGNYALSTYNVMPQGLYGVIKPVTNGPIRLYTYDTVNLVYFPLSFYEPNETLPVYRRSRIPGLKNLNNTTGTCQRTSVTVLAKFRFIPAVSNSDYVQIPHLDAIRLGAQAILREESNDLKGANDYWAMAFGCLQSQLGHYSGSGVIAPIKFQTSGVWGAGFQNLR
ncbi:MAG TPA: hypothetical protein VFQ43_08720 [Nitrososphaera sp.]|nr:hypothetical protein [Nitrososphaera sp.]